MRYRIPQAAYADRRLRGTDLRVLLALEDYTDPKGHCWPSQGRIARDLEMQRPHVNRAITRLEEFGYLVRAGRSGYRSCRYFLTVPTSCTTDGTQSCTTGGTQTLPGNNLPPVVPPKGDVAEPANAGKSPRRRPRAARKPRERSGGPAAAPPTPRPPPPVAGAGGAMVPADIQGAAKALARQGVKCLKSKAERPRGPPDTAIVRALNSGLLTEEMGICLIRREMEIGEAAALEEFGFTARGSPKGKPPDA